MNLQDGISNGLPWDNADIDSDLTVTANWNETDTFEELITNHGDSEEDAIEIPDLGTLERIRDYVNANTNNHCSGKFFKLTNDIRLPQGWTPIGTYSWRDAGTTYFAGSFDGNGHKITLNNNQTEPLFGSINAGSNDTVATVKNLKIQVESSNNLNCALVSMHEAKVL